MKKLFLFIIALVGTVPSFAQISDGVTATLQNGAITTVYYGIDAFKTAITNAQDGGIITLSSGTFNVPDNIDKSVRIYGAGMEDDATTNIAKTYLVGGINIKGVEGVQKDNIYMEGLYINGSIYIENTDDDLIENLKVVKCRFAGLDCRENSNHFILRQCRIEGSIGGSSSVATGMMVQNCYITGRIGGFATESAVLFDHCLSVLWTDADYENNRNDAHVYKNCILRYKDSYHASGLKTGAVAVNCMGCYGYMKSNGNTLTNCYTDQSSALPTYGELFADGQNDLDYYIKDTTTPRTWKLVAPETYVGDDNTQIGPAGGEFAWDFIPSTPRITQSNIASKTVDGKLSISIKAEARPVVE